MATATITVTFETSSNYGIENLARVVEVGIQIAVKRDYGLVVKTTSEVTG